MGQQKHRCQGNKPKEVTEGASCQWKHGAAILIPGQIGEAGRKHLGARLLQGDAKEPRNRMGWIPRHRRGGTQSPLDTQLQRVFCPSQVQEHSFCHMTRHMNIPCLFYKLWETNGTVA